MEASDHSDRHTSGSTAHEGRGTIEADAAIRAARAGRLGVPDMLRTLVGAQVIVPLAHEPTMEGNAIQKWAPATVTKADSGAAYLVAFTDSALARQFATVNAAYRYSLLVDAKWLLSALPPGHGIVFNVAGASALEWSASGIAEYLSGLRGAGR